MLAFWLRQKPIGYNSSGYAGNRKRTYHQQLQSAFEGSFSLWKPTVDCYEIVIWVNKTRRDAVDPDADNISKPVWDALRGFAYEDDRTIRHRTAAILTVASAGLPLGLSMLPDMFQEELDTFLADVSQENLLYVCIGELKAHHYTFHHETGNHGK